MNEFKDGWIEDENGNRCSVDYFGSEEAAREALASLKNCKRCINCSGCSDCSDCSGCSGCSDCSGCSRCSHTAFLYDKKDLHADPAAAVRGSPPIPRIESIHQAVYAAVSQPNALDMGSWHVCDTTHCRAGWVIALAGEAGKALEDFHNTPLAAQLIYRESGYEINPCRFYDTNEAAMEDMRRLADGSAMPEAQP
jgi:hypothetical protein